MLLDRIDIDAHGPLNCVELGPFAEHLNVVSSPDGSGKTAIVRFVRDSLVTRDYPLGMMSSSTGRIVWADRYGILHCRREKDGTATGRRTVEFESRGDLAAACGPDVARSPWLGAGAPGNGVRDGHLRSSGFLDSHLAMQSIQLPESLVDGVITDTALTSVARVVSACVRSGLNSPDTFRGLPLTQGSVYRDRDARVDDQNHQYPAGDRRHLREELASIEAELARLASTYSHVRPTNDETQRESLLARRTELSARLDASHRSFPRRNAADHFIPRSRYIRWQDELTRLHEQTRQLRFRQSELRRWIAEIDREMVRDQTCFLSEQSATHAHAATVADANLRRQLDDLDSQMIRWRRALLDIRGLRQTLSEGRDSFGNFASSVVDEAALRRMRLDGFLHAIDRYEPSRGMDDLYHRAYAGQNRPLVQIDEIDARVDSATRHIDWLLSRYDSADNVQFAWYESVPSSSSYRSATSLGETLRAIRADLHQVGRCALALIDQTLGDQRHDRGQATRDEIAHSESWLIAAMDGLMRHRDALLNQHAIKNHQEPLTEHQDRSSVPTMAGRFGWAGLRHEHEIRIAELEQVSSELNDALRRAAEIRRSMRSLPVIDSMATYEHQAGDFDVRSWEVDSGIDRDAVLAEMRHIDAQLAHLSLSRSQSSASSRIQWLQNRRAKIVNQLQTHEAVDQSHPIARSWSPLADAATRWLIRLSAGRLNRVDWDRHAFEDSTAHSHVDATGNHRWAVVAINGRAETECRGADRGLAAMAVRLAAGDLLGELGRPVPLILETHRALFDDVAGNELHSAASDSHGGRSAYWQSGDHGRVNHPIATALRDYARRGRQVIVLTSHPDLADQLTRVGARNFAVHAQRTIHPHRPIWQSQYEPEGYVGPHPHLYGGQSVEDLNEYSGNSATSAARDINRDFDRAWREDHRDGYFFADQYTTSVQPAGPSDSLHRSLPRHTPKPAHAPESPFFLSVDSPVDQAPSIDAVAAARLRGLSVTHVNHLMQQDSNRLADALGLANVDASTIRRWQAECRLVCRVPQLRGFDARVLVGCRITTPAQLASIHPVDLLVRVEGFLATDRGQQLLLSGSSHELSRLTSWIAAANCNDSDRHEYDDANGDLTSTTRRRRAIRTINGSVPGNGRTRRRTRTTRSDAFSTAPHDVVQYDRAESEPRQRRSRKNRGSSGSTHNLRFYLQRDSPVVDAPSIGNRMADRLHAIGIDTVDDLLTSDAASVADQLRHRRVDADMVSQWQQQAALVCRVPLLRGHDAQLLVAVDVTTPEELALQDVDDLFGIIDPVARSSDGKRIVRGGKLPDRDEVNQWIRNARNQRTLDAA